MTPARTFLVAGCCVLAVAPLHAQTLAARLAAIRTEVVAFHFTARPGVCGDGEHFIRTGRSSYHGSFSSGRAMEPCSFGPVQVRLTINEGTVDRVQYFVGRLRDRNARDLGAAPSAEAARYLMTLASEGPARVSAKAIFPAVLADSATVVPALLAIARDTETRSRGTRQEALQWLSRFATGAIEGRRNDPFAEDYGRDDPDEEIKVHAVFVLSQLRGGGVPELLDVARSRQSTRVRGQAMFWLGQTGDPRALALFESVLR